MGGRAVRREAAGEVWNGQELMDPPDAVPVSRTRVPLDHAVVTALGRGASLRISGAFGTLDLPGRPAARAVVRLCRSLAARG